VTVVDVLCPYVVGRGEQLAMLTARLDAAANGAGGLVFVCGAAGIGKSRLTRELAALAAESATGVLVGRAVEQSGQIPYRPVAEVLLQAFRDRGLPQDPAVARFLPILAPVLPLLLPDAPGAEPGAAVRGEALIRVLRWTAASRPLLVVFEDLHWADPDTLAIVEYLADNLARESMLGVCTVRDESPSPGLELARRLRQRGAGTILTLEPLAPDAVADMVRACVPSAGPDLVARVQAVAEGLPLLVEELLATPGIPATVEEAVRARVAELTEPERSVLYAAAVLGREFDWPLLSEITGLPASAVTAVLERLVSALLIRVDGDGFRFRHALTREAVVASVVPPRRKQLAGAALAALDRARPGHEHAELAVQAGDLVRAGELLAAAGTQALRRGALHTAANALRQAVDLAGAGLVGGEAQAALVRALALAGRLEEALNVGAELLGRPTDDPAAVPMIHLELAQAAVSATRWDTAREHLDTVRALLGDAGPSGVSEHVTPLGARLAVLDAEVALAADDLDEARRSAESGLRAAGPAAPDVRCHALELIGRSHRVHDLARAKTAFEQEYRLADEADLPVWRLRARHELGTIEMLDHGGMQDLQAARRIAEETGALSITAVLDLQLAGGYLQLFDTGRGLDHARQAAELSRSLDLPRVHTFAHVFVACAQALRGDRAAVRDAISAARRTAPDDAEIEGLTAAGATGMLELLWGEPTDAVTAFDRGLAALHSVAGSPPGPYRALWPLLLAAQGRADAADGAELVRRSGVTVSRINRGLLHYADAVLQAAAGPVTAGDADLRYFPVWQHLGRCVVAEAALRDSWGEPERWLREARECFQAYRLDHLDRRCARLLRQPAGWTPAGITAREADVLELLAAGLANKEIAQRLRLSARTVEKHVESLLRKAGARSRTQLVAMLRPAPGRTT
jgi:DNA-binding CsgD family transcriptional regulator